MRPTATLTQPTSPMAMAKGARQLGVTVERKWQADGFALERRSHWDVTCNEDGREGRQSGAV